MKMSSLIQGLSILSDYFDEDGYRTCAEHDILFVNETDRPVGPNDEARLKTLGWIKTNSGWEAYV